MIYQFNHIELDTEKFTIKTNNEQQHVEPQVFNLIVYLLENRECIVSRDTLLKYVWNDRIVSDTSITNSIKSARKILGDDGQNQKVIKTIHSRGYQFIAEVTQECRSKKPNQSTSKPLTPDTYTNSNAKTWVMTLLIVAFTVLAGYLLKQPSFTQESHQKESIKSIAVLPFFNSSPNADSNYYGFALADQIIGEMNYLEQISVRPSSSVRKYATINYDPISVGETLGVDYILSGHYMINGNNIRISAELVHTQKQKIIWRGKPIHTPHQNTFKVQDMLVKQVIAGLKMKFPTHKLSKIQQNIPQSPLAYEYYLRSIAYPYTTDGHRLAVDMLKQSLLLDDQYAPTYIQLGNRTRRLAQFGLIESDTSINTEQYYLKALSLNKDSLDAMAYLSMFYTESNRIDEAIELAQDMHQLNPNNANTKFTLGYIYRYAGMLDEAIEEMEGAVAIDPHNIKFRSLIGTYSAMRQYQKALDMTALYQPSPFTYGWQALMHMNLGNTEKALALYDFIIKKHPQNLWAKVAIIHKSYLLNDFAPGLEAIASLTNTDVSDGETIYYTAAYYGLLGEKDKSIDMLQAAINAGYFNYRVMASNKYFEAFKASPEFKAVIQNAKIKHLAFRKKHFPKL
ncbi:winged helix-turn-helix domain-containing protein [Marinicella rhabdoformis]|uniref:winged helix-turn-helix domain-containing protein n=1 Tax=Marinicella rhabdoformis TaxID=2580566 RepID=UPI0012AEB240|nr:winged helix-turn-helix domain-containing protein [Marinicella rhabdoformis]